MPVAFDVAVIGGGPGGAAAALAAARLGLRVLLGAAQDLAADRPCGEGIMPAGVAALRGLGLGAAVEAGRAFPGLRHRVAGAPPLDTDLPAPAVAIPRPAHGAALAAALAARPEVRRVRAWCAALRDGGAFVVDAGPAGRFAARTLVVADGGAGPAAPWLRRRAPGPGGRFGLRARCVERRPLDRVEVHVGNGCEVYLTPLPGGVVNVAVLFERAPTGVAGPDRLLGWALGRHPAAAAAPGAAVTPPAARGHARARPRAAAGRGAFAVGDALGRVDPILGCGVTIAVRTGVLAARAAARLLAGADAGLVARAYARACRRESRGRHALAEALRAAGRHPRLARGAVAAIARLPRAARALSRVAAGPS
jgi:flavin-dependent dehydrogenase